MGYRFKPSLPMTLLTALLLAVFVKAGLWQWHKAELKQAQQKAFDARLWQPPVALPQQVADAESWSFRRIREAGHYDTGHQILLDNQISDGVVGYHVITPFKPLHGEAWVLVDRGWIPAGDRNTLPPVTAPAGPVEVAGYAWVPSRRFLELQAPPVAGTQWQPLWQNLDLERYAKVAPFRILPFVLRLDAGSTAGGFVRDWPKPAERIEMHIGYAWQWFGFAVALALIYLFVNLKRTRDE